MVALRLFFFWTDYESLLKSLSVSTPLTRYCFHSIILSQRILWYRWLAPWITLGVVFQLKAYYDSIAQWTKNQRHIYLLGQNLFWLLATSHFWNSFHLGSSTQVKSCSTIQKQNKPLLLITSITSLPTNFKDKSSLCTYWRDPSPDPGGLDPRIPKLVETMFLPVVGLCQSS